MSAIERPIRFGVVVTSGHTAASWTSLARRIEQDGFDSLLVADHYANDMACTPMIAAAAAATTTLRLGSYVYCNEFRHPALLAKEIATLDVLSGGRIDFGLGAGWLKDEFDQIGLVFDAPKVRADRFEEAVALTTSALAGGTVSFSGQHYQLHDYVATPRPVQAKIPLLVGGGGRRMVDIAARYADIFALAPRSLPGGGLTMSDLAEPVVRSRLDRLRQTVADSGRVDGGPEVGLLLFGIFTDTDARPADSAVPAELTATSPYVWVGDPARVVDTILERRETLGITYYVCFDHDLEAMTPIVSAFRGR